MSWVRVSGLQTERMLSKGRLNGLPRTIFVNDMGDTFTASLPLDWLALELRIMAASPHNWILLTKRADRQREFSLRYTLPANVWAGVSITSPQDQRLRYLLQTRARIRWVSYEPMLAPVDWRPWLGGNGRVGLDWIIVGGASGADYQSQMMNL